MIPSARWGNLLRRVGRERGGGGGGGGGGGAIRHLVERHVAAVSPSGNLIKQGGGFSRTYHVAAVGTAASGRDVTTAAPGMPPITCRDPDRAMARQAIGSTWLRIPIVRSDRAFDKISISATGANAARGMPPPPPALGISSSLGALQTFSSSSSSSSSSSPSPTSPDAGSSSGLDPSKKKQTEMAGGSAGGGGSGGKAAEAQESAGNEQQQQQQQQQESNSPPAGKEGGGGRSLRSGPVTWGSLALLLATGGGILWYYDREKKRRLAEVKIGPGVGTPAIGGPFTLVDHNGKRVTEKDFQGDGQFKVFYFGFTFCPDICPEELRKLAMAVDLVKKKAKLDVRPIFVSVDPERDTPAAVKEYVKGFHPQMIGLTGTKEEVKAVAKAYRVYYMKTDEKDDAYMIDHSIVMYLMDPDMNFVKFFGKNYAAEELADGLIKEVRAWKKK